MEISSDAMSVELRETENNRILLESSHVEENPLHVTLNGYYCFG